MPLFNPSASGGALELIEKKVLGANATTVTFSGLNGDADGLYILDFVFPESTGALEIEIRPNGVTTNLVCARSFGGSSSGSVTDTKWMIFDTSAARFGSGRAWIQADSSLQRSYQAHCLSADIPDALAGVFVDVYAGLWDDAATNITSLDIVADVANEIKAGAILALYKVKQS